MEPKEQASQMVRNIGKLRRNPDKFQQMIANIPREKLTEMESVHEMAQFYTKSHQSSAHYLVLHSSQQHECLPQAKNFFWPPPTVQIHFRQFFLVWVVPRFYIVHQTVERWFSYFQRHVRASFEPQYLVLDYGYNVKIIV